jgi:hypothetical protein
MTLIILVLMEPTIQCQVLTISLKVADLVITVFEFFILTNFRLLLPIKRS